MPIDPALTPLLEMVHGWSIDGVYKRYAKNHTGEWCPGFNPAYFPLVSIDLWGFRVPAVFF